MRVSLICAASENGVIGQKNQLPWKLPADLARFKKLTLNHTVLMGRKTFQSIGKALPERRNVVITRQKEFQAPGCLVAGSVEEVLQLCQNQEEVFVIGGASIYEQALPHAHKIYLTRIHQSFPGDTFLFTIDPNIWKETSREDCEPDGQNPYPYSFLTYERK